MKNYFYLILAPLALFSGRVMARDYSAQKGIDELCKDPVDCPIKDPEDIFRILKTVVQYTYTIFFIVAVFFILVAAFNFLTAKGDPTKVEGARKQIFWAVIAIAIALISVGATQVIKTFITTGN